MFLQKTKVTKKRPDAKPLFCAAAHRPFGRGTPVSGGGDGQKYAFFTDRPNVSHKKGYLCGYGTSCETGAGSHRSAARCVRAAHAAAFAAPSAARLREIAASPSAALFAAEAGGCVRGLLTLVWYDVPSGRKAWIEDVVVDAEVRGTGAGRVLVAAALEHAAVVGAGEVLLTSNPAREAARALYRKMGFEEAATTVFAIKTDAE